MKKFTIKTLATSLSAVIATTVAMQAQASDIEIYKEATNGATSLVFMLDISGSMDINSVFDDYYPTYADANQTRLNWVSETSGQPNVISMTLANRNRQAISAHYRWEQGFSNYRREYRRIDKAKGDATDAIKEQCVLDGAYYKCYSRMARLQDAFYLLLNGGADLKGNKIEKISDDKVIGLSTLGVFVDGTRLDTGRMVVPSRRLDAVVNGKTQRQILTEEMSKFTPSTNTPTARSFAEVVAYFMGKNTINPPPEYKTSATQYLYIPSLNRRFRCDNLFPTRCNATRNNQQRIIHARDILGFGKDAGEDRLMWTSWPINIQDESNNYTSQPGYVYVKAPDKVIGVSGFNHSDSSTKNGSNYISPLDGDSCSSQGVYVLTDGEPTQDSGSEGLFASAFGESIECPKTGDSFFCAIEASKKLLSGNHARRVPIKTAVVGFGDVFTRIPSYDASLSVEENLANVGVVNGDIVGSLDDGDRVANVEQKRAAAWGIVGGGGWYSGASTVSVVDSVNKFLKTLTNDIPSITTGSPTIPVNTLNRQTLLTDAYYASFTPKPSESQQLWTGNMNKYVTKGGALYGQDNQPLFQNGLLNANVLGMWDRDVEEAGTIKTLKGVHGNLKLRTDVQNNTQRKVYTESAGNARALTQVTVQALNTGALRNSPAKNHWLNLLGYDVAENEVVNFNRLSEKAELRQLGATMHSSPLVLTQSGKTFVNNRNELKESNRDDYVVYGSTQGVLHIVDADTGEEKFAFVPQKMVEKQKQAFLKESATSGGKENLFYGIDGAWVNHTEYVVRADGALTVGSANPSDVNAPKGKQWIYGGLRMGGKNYYGLDLSNIANPAKEGVPNAVAGQVTGTPVLKFNIDPEAETIYTSTGRKVYRELAHMGQSWSRPSLGYVRWNGERKLVMFVGGGYDEGYEASDYNQTNGVGAGVYMFDANTGELLWWASNNTVTTPTGGVVKHNLTGDDTNSLQYSVVSRINTIDRDSDGLIDALYFGDLAGQGFRIDLNNANRRASGNTPAVPFSIRVVKIFNEHTDDGLSPRFYEMPSVSIQKAQDGSAFMVAAFGSGDRSSPLAGARIDTAGNPVVKNANTADDMTLVVYDYDVGNSAWKTLSVDNLKTRYTKGALKPAVLNSIYKDTEREVVADGVNQGWKYTFIGSGDRKGRYKTFSEPSTLINLLRINTYDRDGGGLDGQCGAGVIGVSRAYQFCLPTGICQENEHGYVRNQDTPVSSQESMPGLMGVTTGMNEDGQFINVMNSKSSNTNSDDDSDKKCEGLECVAADAPSTISQLRWYEARKGS